jgi:hypothetical protein
MDLFALCCVQRSVIIANSFHPGSIKLSTGEVNDIGNNMRGDINSSGGHIQAAANFGGNLELYSGSSDSRDAGDVSIVSGSSNYAGGGHINIIASANRADERYWLSHIRREILPNEINFGFDDYTPLGFMERKIALQLKKTKDSTRYHIITQILFRNTLCALLMTVSVYSFHFAQAHVNGSTLSYNNSVLFR